MILHQEVVVLVEAAGVTCLAASYFLATTAPMGLILEWRLRSLMNV